MTAVFNRESVRCTPVTLIAVPISVPSAEAVPHVLDRAREASAMGATLVEWRVDELVQIDDSIEIIKRLVRDSPMPCIVTCRPTWEGGQFQGDDDRRWKLFAALLRSENKPRLIDIELRAWLNAPHEQRIIASLLEEAKTASDGGCSLILSAHDFTQRPADLIQKIEAMTNEPACDVIKVAWTARSLRDNLEAFDLLRERQKPTIALCMGEPPEVGLMSRVLAPKFGGLLTFASDSPKGETAPGQPTIRELRELYRFDSITRETRTYGVIGWPVGHSKGPLIHNAGFAAVDHDGVYLPLPIPPEYEHFKATVGALIDQPGLNFRGASVTIPHKGNLLRFVQERGGRMDAMSEACGAANTLIIGSAGGIECRNTDCPALVDALCEAMNVEPQQLAGRRIAVLGAGGVARAAVAGLMETGAEVVVFNRTRAKAEALVAEWTQRETASGQRVQVAVADEGAANGESFDVVVNCTSIGMAGGPAPDDSPLPAGIALNGNVTVFETVYAPVRTPLVKEAEARGARIVTGIEMFLRQAALQFEAWTGKAALLDAFRAALRSSNV
jgi:3-dehydroquinate dehydratase / shikimate dehydrogenase